MTSAPRTPPERFHVTLEVTLRECEARDVPLLEWGGLYTAHRELIARAYQRHLAGENLILVAESQGYPIGQVWVDLTRKAARSIALLWALRVLPGFQGLRLGSRLMGAAERVVRAHGLRIAEVGAEKDNPGARRLYERLGYQLVGEAFEEYGYTTPEGTPIRATVDQWVFHKEVGAAPPGL